MYELPGNWPTVALESAGIEPTARAMTILRAWRNSTPLPDMANNPTGMPWASSRATTYLGTDYAIFPDMAAFYAAFSAFLKSTRGSGVSSALGITDSYPAAWRAISALGWPAGKTETDYPSRLLDLTSQKYRDSVGATVPVRRKTSGIIGGASSGGLSPARMSAVIFDQVARGATGIRASQQ